MYLNERLAIVKYVPPSLWQNTKRGHWTGLMIALTSSFGLSSVCKATAIAHFNTLMPYALTHYDKRDKASKVILHILLIQQF